MTDENLNYKIFKEENGNGGSQGICGGSSWEYFFTDYFKLCDEFKTYQEIEEIINDREYITKISTNHTKDRDLDAVLKMLPDLEELSLVFSCFLSRGCKEVEEIDFYCLTNLKVLNLFIPYDKEIDFSRLPKLERLQFGFKYPHTIDFSTLPNLKKLILCSVYDTPIDISPIKDLRVLMYKGKKYTFEDGKYDINFLEV